MTRTMADRRADQLRDQQVDKSFTFKVEPETEGSKRYVIKKYRHGQPTGTTYYI